MRILVRALVMAALLLTATPAHADDSPFDVNRVRAAESGPQQGLTAVGDGHACALVNYQDLWCWGTNDQGQIGNGTTTAAPAPVRITGRLGQAAQLLGVDAGRAHTCALSTGAGGLAVFCWGANEDGQLGDGSFERRTRPELVSTDAVQVVTGRDHTCVLTVELTVSCWGANDDGQLGSPTPGTSDANPQPVPGLSDVLDVAVGDDRTCAVKENGEVWCWGAGEFEPRKLPGGPFSEVTAGRRHVCALGPYGAAYCWGSNARGQLGVGTGDQEKPRRLGARAYSVIRAGGDSTCALTAAGQAYCWGANEHGQLGIGDKADRATPALVDRRRLHSSSLARLVLGPAGARLGDLSLGGTRACAVDLTETFYCTRDDLFSAVRLAPGNPRQVKATARRGALRVTWHPPRNPGADPAVRYAAIAFTGTDLDAGRTCYAATKHTCMITGLTANRRYTVLVAAISRAGISYSAPAAGTPAVTAAAAAGGQGAGLPITGPGSAAALAVVLLIMGSAVRSAASLGCRNGNSRLAGRGGRGPRRDLRPDA
ncbi:fibronectin type III domain-containing protein [Actinoplanes sp. TFC3]|uniref:RCC1 domain-containing protein n=1 Tax=Actinoplanes sp. TFC3 TaxID=1710355 RepID=UPI00082CD6FE|nr:fibronectin type III domain-containing protein [Actinoplanes sp. TFC3]